MKRSIFLILLPLLCGCGAQGPQDQSTIITSMQIIDRNGFAETISNKDRIKMYKDVDFLTSQPYQKVLRVYGRNLQGQSTARMTSYHDNGQLWQYLEVTDGRAHGYYREWFSNGQLKIEAYLIEGLADLHDLAQKSWIFDGLSRVWDDQGHLVAEIYYQKGELHTPSLYYHPNGKLQKIIPYEAGLIQGDLILYDEQGSILEQTPYIAGQKQGKAQGSWGHDRLKYWEEYERDLLQTATYYDPTGKQIAEIKEGKGSQAIFQGEFLYSSVEYHGGVPDGAVKVFAPDGTLHCSYHVKDSKKEGEEIEYYPSKAADKPLPKICVHWHEDKLQGVIKTWYPNGVLESQREINGNKKQGLSFAWYKNGDLMLMEEYENDLLAKGSYFKKADKMPVSKIEGGKGVATLYSCDGIFIRKIGYEKGHPKLEDEILQ